MLKVVSVFGGGGVKGARVQLVCLGDGVASLYRMWPVRAKLYWSASRNVPMYHVDDRDDCFEVNIVAPGDYRLGLEGDYRRLREAIVNEFGSDKLYRMVFEGRVIVLNKVPYMDEMKEVIVDGGHAGKLYFDPFRLSWRFRLSRYTARLAVEEGLVHVYRLGRGEKPQPIIRVSLDAEEDAQVVIVDWEGEPVALGYYRGGAIHLQTRFGGEREPLENARRSTIDDVLKANALFLEELVSKALAFIHVMREKTSDRPLLVSFSGGKDSLVALHLTLKLGLDPIVVFNDTGLELPETVETVYRTVERYGLRLEVASAGDAFWRAVEFFGPPAKDYRWCCKIVKLGPMARLVNSRWPRGALNIVGQRAFESLDRAKTPRVWRNRWFPQLLNISPIQYWNSFMIWLYIFREKLDYNPLYNLGYERIGCYMCPASSLAEYNYVSRTHPTLWKRWWNVLERWRCKLCLPPEWSRHGLWRWLGPAEQKLRLARRLGVEESVLGWRDWFEKWSWHRPKLEEKGDRVVIAFREKLDSKPLAEQAPVLGKNCSVGGGGGRVVVETPIALYSFDGVRLEVVGKHVQGDRLLEEAFDALKIVYRGNYCVGCFSCESNCPRGAIKVVGGRPIVDATKCIACRLCLDVCPIAEVYVEKIEVARLLGKVDASKRPSKRRISDVVEKAKVLHRLTAPKTEKTPEETVPWTTIFDTG